MDNLEPALTLNKNGTLISLLLVLPYDGFIYWIIGDSEPTAPILKDSWVDHWYAPSETVAPQLYGVDAYSRVQSGGVPPV